MSEEVIVFVTCPETEAQDMAKQLVEANLVACVNMIPSVKSVFMWEGKLSVEEETLLVMKTNRARWAALEEQIKETHSYDVPEIICVPIIEGHKPYLDWLNRSVAIPTNERQKR